MLIPFIKPYLTGLELHNIACAFSGFTLGEGGNFSVRAEKMISDLYNSPLRTVVTTSIGTSFELVADLLRIKPGDEVILPSFTYVSSANAFSRRGASLCFVDILKDNLCVNIDSILASINNNTRVIILPHYAGNILDITNLKNKVDKYNIKIIQDLTGSFAIKSLENTLSVQFDLACGSFHEDEYIHSGDAGYLICNDSTLVSEIDLLKYRGTNKAKFLIKEAEYFGWEKIGGEYCANELTCSFLCGQLVMAGELQLQKIKIWENYRALFTKFDKLKLLTIPVAVKSTGNFYLILPENFDRKDLIVSLARVGVEARGHFYPLHLTNAGKTYGYFLNNLNTTESIHDRVIRLPSFISLENEEQERIVKLVIRFVENKSQLN